MKKATIIFRIDGSAFHETIPKTQPKKEILQSDHVQKSLSKGGEAQLQGVACGKVKLAHDNVERGEASKKRRVGWRS